ncbi:hypothetical protein [Actinomadura chokoriensis]|uniref:hypothetical protein n=1 Tax=Actinomadura chokoriensis TaxID=454156 RepID=UPI0031F86D70
MLLGVRGLRLVLRRLGLGCLWLRWLVLCRLVLVGGGRRGELDVPGGLRDGRLVVRGAADRDVRAGQVDLRGDAELGGRRARGIVVVLGAGRVRFPLGFVVHVPTLLDSTLDRQAERSPRQPRA